MLRQYLGLFQNGQYPFEDIPQQSVLESRLETSSENGPHKTTIITAQVFPSCKPYCISTPRTKLANSQMHQTIPDKVFHHACWFACERSGYEELIYVNNTEFLWHSKQITILACQLVRYSRLNVIRNVSAAFGRV